MQNTSLFDQVLSLAKLLPTKEKIKLIEQIAPEIEHKQSEAAQMAYRQSLRGLWKDIEITDEDIASARQEMWENFPREDF